jgi:hypothetical protein
MDMFDISDTGASSSAAATPAAAPGEVPGRTTGTPVAAAAVALLAASEALAVEAAELLVVDTMAADTPVPLAAAAVMLLALALSFLPVERAATLAAVLIVAFVGCAATDIGLVTLTDAVTDPLAAIAGALFVKFVVLVVTFVVGAAATLDDAAAFELAAAAAAELTAALLALLDAATPPVDRIAALTAGVVISSPDAGS